MLRTNKISSQGGELGRKKEEKFTGKGCLLRGNIRSEQAVKGPKKTKKPSLRRTGSAGKKQQRDEKENRIGSSELGTQRESRHRGAPKKKKKITQKQGQKEEYLSRDGGNSRVKASGESSREKGEEEK